MKILLSLVGVLLIICLFINNSNTDNFQNCPLTHPLDIEKTMSFDGQTGNCPVNKFDSQYPKTKCFTCETQSIRTYGTNRYGVNTKSVDAEETSKQVFGTYRYGQPSSCFDCE